MNSGAEGGAEEASVLVRVHEGIGHLELQRLERGQRRAERAAVPHVGQRLLQRRARAAE